MKKTLTAVKQLIEEGDIKPALDGLKSLDLPDYQMDRLTSYYALYNRIEQHRCLGDVTDEYINMEECRITEGIVSMIDSISKYNEIEQKRSNIPLGDFNKDPRLLQIEIAVFIGLIMAAIGLALVLISHNGREDLSGQTFLSGIVFLFFSLIMFLFTRFFIAPKVISSFQRSDLQSRDVTLLFTDLTQFLGHIHEFAVVHIGSLEALTNSNDDSKINLSSQINEFKTVSDISDDTMNILEDIEKAIRESEVKDLEKFSIDIEKNTFKIKEIMRK
jgi:hypothetical protein